MYVCERVSSDQTIKQGKFYKCVVLQYCGSLIVLGVVKPKCLILYKFIWNWKEVSDGDCSQKARTLVRLSLGRLHVTINLPAMGCMNSLQAWSL